MTKLIVMRKSGTGKQIVHAGTIPALQSLYDFLYRPHPEFIAQVRDGQHKPVPAEAFFHPH